MNRFSVLAGTVSLVALMAGPALAQDAAPKAGTEANTLEEVVVTAQKRSEKLHDVPVSVAAVSARVLQEQGISKPQDLQSKVPNFAMTETGVGTNIAIRGIFSGVNQGFEQSVGMYVDGIHYGLAQQTRAPFFDVDRVEVLRGPQSILFGKNAVAGALNIVSAAPSRYLTGYVQAGYETQYGDMETVGVLSGPLSDRMRFRVAGRWHSGEGYIHNATLDREEPNREDWNLRGIVDYDVTDDLKLSFKAETGRFDVVGRNIEIFGETPSTSANPAFAGKTYDQILSFIGAMSPVDAVVVDPSVNNIKQDGVRSSNGDYSNNRTNNYVLTANWYTPLGTVTSVSGVSRFRYDELCDCDFTGAVVFNAGLQERYKQVSQEVRLVSPKGERFDYILGGFYQTSTHDYSDQINVPLNSVLVPVINLSSPGNGTMVAGTRASRIASVDADTWSFFGQVGYNFTDKLHLTLGARYTREEKNGARNLVVEKLDGTALAGPQAIAAPLVYANLFRISSSNLHTIAGMPIPQAAVANALLASLGSHPVSGSIDEKAFNPSVNLQYRPNSDVMLYASWTTGSKSGGFDFRGNNRGFYGSMADAFAFSPEKAQTWETGAKLKLLGGRAELNTSAYYTKMRDLQTSVFDGVLGYVVGNADARTYGIEADGRFALTSDLTLRGSASLTDFEFTDYKNGQCYPGQTTHVVNPATQQCDYTGQSNQLVAPWQAAAAIDYRHPLSDQLEFKSSFDVYATGKYFAAATLDPAQVQAAYANLNLRVAVAETSGKFELALLARNLTDERPLQFGFATPLAYNTFKAISHVNVVGQGRTFTVQARLKF